MAEIRDPVVRAVLEFLATRGLLAVGVEFRFSVDFVQIIRDGQIIATFNPSKIV